MTTTRKTFPHTVIGIDTHGTIYTLDSVFDHGDGFRGATGTTFDAISPDYVEANNSEEDFRLYLEDTMGTATLKDARQWMHESGLEFPGQDDSYSSAWPAIKKEAGIPDDWTLTCTGGGRCFGRNIAWKRIVRQDLLDLVLSYEAE